MHILTLTSLFPNSRQPLLAVFIRARMEHFTRKFGHKWTVVAPVPFFPRLPFAVNAKYDLLARVPRFEDERGYPVHHPRYLVTPGFGMRWYGLWMTLGVRALVKRIHDRDPIDFIDAHYLYPDGSAAAEMGAALGIPVILSARGTDLNVYPRIPSVLPMLKDNLRRSRTLVCVCRDLQTKALELGVPEAKIRVIGNGVDVTRFHRGDAGEAREKLGIPGNAKVFLSVGNLIESKGFHLVLEALAALRRPDAFLCIAGQGILRARLEQSAASLGIREQVRFAGGVPNGELPAWYRAADVFVLATEREGWPNVVCEAQACGLPVVATRVSGIPEIVTNPSLGILIGERAAEPLRKAMAEALEFPWDRERIARAGQARTWDQVADELSQVFSA